MEDLERRAKELFGEAWELAGAEREAFLASTCAADARLEARVRALLTASDQADAGGLLAGDAGDGLRDAFVRYAERVDPDDESRTVLAAIEALQGHAPRVRLGEGEDDAPQAGRAAGGPTLGPKGHYRILGEIARGGMGVVLRGRDTDLGREVAVKVLHEGLHHRPAVVERFVEEAQIGGQLQHPGIVPVYELGLMADQRPYFTMKLVRGRTLAELLAERGEDEAALPRLLSVFEHVCQTVAYAHSRHVIHRDLKPNNVMVGKFGEVQVVDWGLAKVIGPGAPPAERDPAAGESSMIETVRSKDGSGASAHSIAGAVMGTPAYMSPEQARGRTAELDERTDVFALGAILCEILTGEPPYAGAQKSTVLLAARGELGPAVERLRRCEADEELVSLALACLAPDREARPRHAGALADALAEHSVAVAQRLRRAELSVVAERMRTKAARKIQRAASLAAAAVGVALVASLVLWQRARVAAAKEAAARVAESDAKQELEHANVELGRSNAELADALTRAGEEAQKANTVSDFLVGVLSSGNPIAGGRYDVTVREAVDDARGRIEEGSFEGQPDVEARVRRAIAEAYSAVGDDDRARVQVERAYQLALAGAGQETGETLTLLAQLGGALRRQGQLDEGERTLKRVLERMPRVEGVTPNLEPLTLSALASVERDRARYDAAEAYSLRAVDLARAVGSDELLADVLNDLSLAQDALGKTDEAIATQEEAIERGRRARGARHFGTGVAMTNLASLYARVGRNDEAEPLYLEALEVLRTSGGGTHPMVSGTLDALGRLYTRTGGSDEAWNVLTEALAIRRANGGPDDVSVAFSLNNLATLEANLGLLEESAGHLAEALPIFVAERGADHPSAAKVRANLASVQQMLARPEATIGQLRRVVASTEARLGADDPATASAKHNLAIALSQDGQLDEAEQLCFDALGVRAARFGERSAERASSIDVLAATLRRRGRLVEAEDLAREALEIRREVLGPTHRDVALSLNTLAEILIQSGPPGAEELLTDAVEIGAAALPADHWALASMRANLATVLLAAGRHAEAEYELLTAHAALTATLGPSHPRTRAVTRQLARTYESWDAADPGAGHAEKAVTWSAEAETDGE